MKEAKRTGKYTTVVTSKDSFVVVVEKKDRPWLDLLIEVSEIQTALVMVGENPEAWITTRLGDVRLLTVKSEAMRQLMYEECTAMKLIVRQ